MLAATDQALATRLDHDVARRPGRVRPAPHRRDGLRGRPPRRLWRTGRRHARRIDGGHDTDRSRRNRGPHRSGDKRTDGRSDADGGRLDGGIRARRLRLVERVRDRRARRLGRHA
jgi:hypothetical protein